MPGGKKIILAAVAGILVVGAVIGCVFAFKHHDKAAPAGEVGTTSKAVEAVCAPTSYKEACQRSLSSVATNQTATPLDLIKAAILYTVDEVKSVLTNSSAIAELVGKDDSLNKMAMEDCKELLGYAVEELQASFSMVGDPSMHNDTDRQAELNNFLSSVISYQETCLDGLNSTELKKAMSDKLLNSSQLSENALQMVVAFADLLKSVGINIETTNKADRQLSEDGYPTWMSAKDRKLLARPGNPRPNAVVAKDGSGRFRTIGAAIKAYPKGLRGRYVIYVKAGVYDEYITVEKNQVNIFMYGDGATRTIITGSKNGAAKVPTFKTATFSTMGDGFIAKNIGFRNTAGPQGHQAVALRSGADRSAFFNCNFEGYQDTLYLQTHRHYIRDCFISGTVDFIFGMGTSVIQNSEIRIRRPMKGQMNTVTAHGRKTKEMATGLTIQNCRFTKEPQTNPTYLGRPWKAYSRTIVMESDLGNNISPAGWLKWDGEHFEDTCFYAEYGNRGTAGANRVRWRGFHNLNRNQAAQYTAGPFIQGNQWLQTTTGPFYLGLAR